MQRQLREITTKLLALLMLKGLDSRISYAVSSPILPLAIVYVRNLTVSLDAAEFACRTSIGLDSCAFVFSQKIPSYRWKKQVRGYATLECNCGLLVLSYR